MRSTRTVARLSERWQAALSVDEIRLLKDFWAISPNENDQIPGLVLSANLDGCTGPFIEGKRPMKKKKPCMLSMVISYGRLV